MRAENQRCLELPAVINGLMRRIAPIDGLTLFSLLGLIGLTLVFGGQLPRGRFLLFGYLLLIGFFLTLKLSSERKSHAGIGYILFPAIGPRFTLAHLQTVPLEGSLYLTYRYERMLFYVYVPIISSLILSTVYLRYHYVIDLFVGTLIAVGCMVIGPRLYSRWNRFHKTFAE